MADNDPGEALIRTTKAANRLVARKEHTMQSEIGRLKGSTGQESGGALEMCPKRVRSVLGLACALAVASGALSLGAVSHGWAAPPAKRDCGSPGLPGQDSDVYARLKCKQEGLVLQLEHMVDSNLTQGAIGLELTDRQKKMMRSERSKAKLLDRQVGAGAFKSVSKGIRKGNRKSCGLVPLDGHDLNLNGLCEPDLGEACAAEEDLTLECNPKLNRPNPGKNGLVCAQVCEAEAALSDDEEEEDVQEVAQDLEATYDAMEDGLTEMNETLEDVNIILENDTAAFRLSSGPCADIEPLPPGLAESNVVLRHTAGILVSVARVTAAWSRQTIVAVVLGNGGGGNSSGLGSIPATVAGVAQEASLIVDDIVSARRRKLQDQTFACLQKAIDDIKAVGGKVDAATTLIETKLDRNQQETIDTRDALSGQMEQVRAELAAKLEEAILLLNTPHGLRPGVASR
jgi:hypothetical protein